MIGLSTVTFHHYPTQIKLQNFEKNLRKKGLNHQHMLRVRSKFFRGYLLLCQDLPLRRETLF